jgi:hypothetical protein
LDARRISGLSDGSAVSQWNDASRSGWNVSQSDSAQRPVYKTTIQGGQPVVRLDGNDRLVTTSVSTTQTFSAITVFQISSSDTNAAVIFDSYNNTQCAFYRGQTNDSPNLFAIAAGSASRSVASSNTSWNVVSCQLSDSTSFGAFNGTKNTVSGAVGTNGLNGISVGDLRGNPNPLVGQYSLQGDIGLLAILPSSLPDPLRRRLEHAAAYSFKISCN